MEKQASPIDPLTAVPSIKPSQPDSQNKLGLAKVRHSLRTPINHIMGYAEILLEEAADNGLPTDFATDLEKIHSCGYILLDLINRYLSEDSFSAVKSDPHAVCHELRTPVNHIIGYSEMLAEQCDELGQSALKSDLDKIASAAYTWLTLMEDHFGSLLKPFSENPATDLMPSGLQAQMSGGLKQDEQFQVPCCGHLLLADDDEANRDLLSRRLEKLGYRVTTCKDGQEVLVLARETAPDLVLLDMLMPVMNGYEVLAYIRSDEQLRHLPVIMISAFDQVESIAHCIELGAEDYLTKPYNPILLRSRISAALEKKRLRDSEQLYLKQIEEEQARSERLLLNILPLPIADRLKSGEKHIVNSYDEVTVMFADLVGFTTLSTQLVPAMLVRLLDQVFTAFDELADKHGLEKIKTIGDAYMAVAGLPYPHLEHAETTVRMAIDMHKAIEKFSNQSQVDLKMRIGICTGPVIAGIIGQNKFIYDLWGDTVNTASRMESHGAPGKTHIASTTYELICDRFQFEERGLVEVKGKGFMKTYFLYSEQGASRTSRT
jgi:class 3 adenylate cyclase/CheY-like chemotaxis protein